MTLQELYTTLNAAIGKLTPGQPLKAGYDLVSDTNFYYLILLMKQQDSFTIYKPVLTWANDNKELDLTGELLIYNTTSSDFKLAFTKDENNQLVSVITGTLPALNTGDMASLNLIDPKADSTAYFPNFGFSNVSMKAASDSLSMNIDAVAKNSNWSILGLSLFPLKEIGYSLQSTIAIGIADPIPQFWFTGSFQLGQTTIQLWVKIPVSSVDTPGQWTATFSVPTPLQNTFQDLSNLLFFNNLNNTIPDQVLTMKNDPVAKTGIFLDLLQIQFTLSDKSIQYVNINVSARGDWKMGPIHLLYSKLLLAFVPGTTSSGMTFSIMFSLTMQFGSLDPLSLSLSIPAIKDNWTVTLDDDGEMNSMDDIKNIPGSVDKSKFNFPASINNATSGRSLKNFTAVFNPYAGTWDEVNIEISYDNEWYIIPDFFKVKSIDLQVNVANGGSGQGVVITGHFETDVFVGSTDTGFDMNLYVEKKDVGWVFSLSAEKIKLTQIIKSLLDGQFKLSGDTVDIVVDYIKLSVDTETSTYHGSGSITMDWPITIAETVYYLHTNVSTDITSVRTDPKNPLNSGYVKGIIQVKDAPGFSNAALALTYKFGDDEVYMASFMGVTVSFYASTGLINLNLGDITLGDIVSRMISWAEPNSSATLESPWDILNDISLKGLNFFFNIKDKSFGFEYKPGNGINLGIVTINEIGLKYVKGKEDKYEVRLLLDGQLFGQPIPEWNVLDPESAPQVPGKGSSSFDLDFLALGQRVSLNKSIPVKTLDDAINAYKDAFKEPASPDKVPVGPTSPVVFNPNSNWLIGARFLIMNTVDIGVIFNDPELYGLLVKLSGEKAKIFSGLEFQIIYKKISDTIGVYEIELKLPDAMRHLEFGAVSVTLPVLGLQIYTNGNFRVDLGFPWNNDFSRSFSVQAFPFIGSGGFYFAWLSGATSTNVPRITSGNFNPVIEFGIGLSLGLGKTIDEGILSGGLSVTVTGILQGVIGFYNPNPLPDGSPAASGSNYYAIQGTFSIVGRVYGSIDFAIIKASFDITVYALARITFICYEPIVVYLEAGVTVRVTVSIDLGLFSINIHLSFSATIHQTFTIGSASTPPWTLASAQDRHLLRAHHSLLTAVNASTPLHPIEMSWLPLKYAQGIQLPPIDIYFMPSLTAALDEQSKTPAQLARYMTMLYIDTTNPNQANPPVSSFTKLASGIVAWAINANVTDKTWTTDIYDEVLTQKVDINYLQNVYTYLTCQKHINIPVTNINDFLQNAFDVSLIYRNTGNTGDQLYGSIFPMFPLLNMSTQFNDQPYGTAVDFADYNTVSQKYQDDITEYFKKITVSYLNPLEAGQDPCSMYPKIAPPPVTDNSMAGFIYEDYFLLMAKGGIGEAIKLMKSYPYSYQDELLTDLADTYGISAAAIALSNKSVALCKGLPLTVSGILHNTDGSEILTSLSGDYSETITDIIALNRTVTTLIREGVVVSLNDGSKTYTTVKGDSFQKIADHLTLNTATDPVSGSIPDLVALSNIAGIALFEIGQPLSVHPPVYHVVQDDTIDAIVRKYNPKAVPGSINMYDFCAINAISSGLLAAGTSVPLGASDNYVIASTDTLLILADRFTSGNMNDLADKISGLKILQALSPAFLPQLIYTTGDTDTFESVSNQFLLAVETITDNNPSLKSVWPENTSITFTNIGALTISAIIDKLKSTGSLDNLSGMAARFLLNGLRLPSPKELSAARTKAAKAKTAKGKAWEPTLDTYPIYELTGQYIVLPALTTQSKFSIALAKDTGADWIHLKEITTKGNNDAAADLNIELDTDDINRIISIQAEVLNPVVNVLRPQPPFMETGMQFNFSNPVSWQYNSSVPLWADMPAGAIPSVWPMPDLLLQTAFSNKKLVPLVKLMLGTHDNPDAPLTKTPVKNYDWALQVPLTVSRLPKDASGKGADLMPHVYQLNSTDEAGLVYLERLIVFNRAQQNDILKSVHILYPPNPSGNHSKGLQSNGLDITTAFVVKTNFSTESNPGSIVGDVLNMDTVVLNSSPKDFIEKTWEASIVQTGGFYLYYSYGSGNEDLPASLFGNSDTATLQLLITFNDQLPKDFIYDFMNAVAIGENINSGNSILFAAAQEQKVNYLYSSADTFAGIASQYNILVDDLGRALKDDTLNSNLPFTIMGIQYEVKPGDNLNGIVSYFGIGQNSFLQNLLAANPSLTEADYSVVWTVVNIPVISFMTGATIPALTTLDQVCTYYHVDIASLSNQVQLVPGLFTGTVKFTDRPVDRMAVVAPGNAGVEMQRKKPDDPTPGSVLPSIYNLLGVSVASNMGFNESGEGLPATSRDPDNNVPGSRLLAEAADGDVWQYLKTVPVAPYAKNNGMVAKDVIQDLYTSNPYAGTGDTVQLNMEWLDLYGNHTWTPFSFPGSFPPATPGPLNYLPIKVRYTDPLIAVEKWPNLGTNFLYRSENNTASLDLIFNFDVSKYAVYQPVDPSAKVNPNDPSSPTRGEQFTRDLNAALINAKTDLQTYRNIYYQVWQQDINITITDTVSNSQTVLNAAQIKQVRSLLNDIYNYLSSIITAGIVYTYYEVIQDDIKPTPYDTAVYLAGKLNIADVNTLIRINLGLQHPFNIDGSVNNDYRIIKPIIPLPAVQLISLTCPDNNTDMIFELKCGFTISRNVALVDDSFMDAAGVGSVQTNLKPISNSLSYSLSQFDEHFDQPGSNQLALTEFAGYFEDAYNKQYAGSTYKIATGTPLNEVVENNASKQLWVIRFGNKGIQFTISGQPIYFSPTPLANSLLSFTGDKAVPISPFDASSGLGTPVLKNFSGVNLDVWGSTFLDAIDQFLLPQYAVPAYIVDQNAASEAEQYLPQLLSAKQTLAKAIVSNKATDPGNSRFLNILSDPALGSGNLGAAQETMRQLLLIKLSNSYNTDAVVQFKAAIVSQYPDGSQKTAPNLYGQPLANELSTKNSDPGQSTQMFSLSTCKLPLTNGSSDFTFTFSTKNKQEQKNFVLDLSYQVNHIEYDITPVNVTGFAGENDDYNASTWLSMVTPLQPVAIIVSPADPAAEIPVPLRTYPTPPSLVSQVSVPHAVSGSEEKDRLDELLQWQYSYTYSQIESAQDSINTQLQFNILPQTTSSLLDAIPPEQQLFANLAQFNEVYAAMQEVFASRLSTITPASKPADMDSARIAMKAFTTIITNTADSWENWNQPVAEDYLLVKTEDTYKYHIEEDKYPYTDPVLDITENVLGVNVTRPADNLFAYPVVTIEGFLTEQPEKGKPIYIFKDVNTGKYLLYADRQKYKQRTLVFDYTNVLCNQNAWASVAELRNFDLVDGNPTTQSFIYQTPDVRFANYLVPYIDTINYPKLEAFNVYLFNNIDPLSSDLLETILAGLFKTLFSAVTDKQKIKLGISYEYALSDAPDALNVVLPFYITPPVGFSIPADYTTSPGCSDTSAGTAFVCQLAYYIRKWFTDTDPVVTSARYLMDLSVYSSLDTQQQMPILRIRNFYLLLANISNPKL
jgi:hypothetical protein